jgi:hypothetical protein
MYHSFSVRREYSVVLCHTPRGTFDLLAEYLREWRKTRPKKTLDLNFNEVLRKYPLCTLVVHATVVHI